MVHKPAYIHNKILFKIMINVILKILYLYIFFIIYAHFIYSLEYDNKK